MGYGRDTFGRNSRNRHGLSFVEFVGCLLALGGGVALGSAYLGVDMKTMFVGILERAELVDPGFFSTEAAAEQAIAIIPDDATNAAAEPVAEIHVSPSGSGVQPPVENSGDTTPKELIRRFTKKERQSATEFYWQGLTECIREEVSHRSMVSGDPNNWRLFDYLSHRRKGHQKAVEAIEALDRRGVDQRLLRHGDQLLNWHHAGVLLYRKAVDLLTDSPNDKFTGPLAQSWQSAATQLRMEERLVRDKHASVASFLDHAFKNAAPFEPAF